MKTSLTITEPTAEDLVPISEVFRITWLATYPNTEAGITEEDILDIDFQSLAVVARRKKAIANADPNKHFLVARDGERVVGVCMVSTNQIRALYVLPTHQSRGIGAALLKKALTWFGNKNIFVNVATYNKRAIEFYTKHGFVATSRTVRSKAAVLPSGKVIPEIEMVKRYNAGNGKSIDTRRCTGEKA